MPIKSTKPSPGNFSASPEPQVTQSQFNRGQQKLNRMLPAAANEVRDFNARMLAMTQPYARAAEMRAGDAFWRLQEEAMMREHEGTIMERGIG